MEHTHLVHPLMLRLIDESWGNVDHDKLTKLQERVAAVLEGSAAFYGAFVAAMIMRAIDAEASERGLCVICFVNAIMATAELAPEADTIGECEGAA